MEEKEKIPNDGEKTGLSREKEQLQPGAGRAALMPQWWQPVTGHRGGLLLGTDQRRMGGSIMGCNKWKIGGVDVFVVLECL